jgi:carbon storage regulator CsrA
MLVLTRKYQEKIRIGDNITITVLRTKGKAVRLGIEAPSDVPVIRGELSFETSDEAEDDSAEMVAAEMNGSVRPAPRPAVAQTWETESPHQPQVELKRMRRGAVTDYLPKLVNGDAPLRSMMKQR